LLRTLAGLGPVENRQLSAPERAAIVFQEPRLLPWKRLWENVTLGLSGGDLKARATDALSEVGLSHDLPIHASCPRQVADPASRTRLLRALGAMELA